MTGMPGKPLEPGAPIREYALKTIPPMFLPLASEALLRPCWGVSAGPGGKQYSGRLQKGRMPTQGTQA